jgi:hypothetical protein
MTKKMLLFSQIAVAFWVIEPDLEASLVVLRASSSFDWLMKMNTLNLQWCGKEKKKKEKEKPL